MVKVVRYILIGLIFLASATASVALDYPSKPVRIIVPFASGTGADLAARIIADKLAKSMGKPFIVENRTGAGGAIGTAAVASALPDGYTLLVNASSQTALPALYKSLPFDSRRDFIGVAAFATSPMVLVASKTKGWRSIGDLIAAARADPGSVSFASAGIGSTTHLSGEKFCLDAGIKAVHVPYKSTTAALSDLISGRVDFLITSLAPTLGPLKEGLLIPLAMGSKRSSALPNVPTFAEVGLRESETWFGLFVPAKTPREIIDRLYSEVSKASDAPDVKERLATMGAERSTMSRGEFDALLRREFAENEQLVKAIGLKPE